MRIAFLAFLFTPLSLQAVPPPPPPDAPPEHRRMDLRMQGQIIGLVGLTPVEGGFGGAELQLNVAVHGVGVAMGLIYEQLARTDVSETFRSGALHVGFQWRMAATFSETVHRYFDPHLDVGFLLGGGASPSEGSLRGSTFAGASIDLPLRYAHPQLVATVQYRFHIAQMPEDLTRHLLVVGLGVRAVSQ